MEMLRRFTLIPGGFRIWIPGKARQIMPLMDADHEKSLRTRWTFLTWAAASTCFLTANKL